MGPSLGSKIRFSVPVTPKGRWNAVAEWQKGPHGTSFLKARVPAPAAARKANDALIRLIAKKLHVAVTRVQIVSGATSRMKVIEVHGVSTLPVGFGADD